MNYNQRLIVSDDETKMDYKIINTISSIGEKVKIATLTKNHEVIALDCFRNSINKLVASGGEVLSFSGYYTCDRITEDIQITIDDVIRNECDKYNVIYDGLISEEITDIYKSDEYQLIGFSTGYIKKTEFIDGSNIKSGDKIIGIKSSGINNSGYDKIQKLLRPSNMNIKQYIEKLGTTLGEALIAPAICYKDSIDIIKNKIEIKGMNYISEGGLLNGIYNLVPKMLNPILLKDSFPILPVFDFIKSMSDLDDDEMFATYNMGIGMIVVVNEKEMHTTINIINSMGDLAYEIGHIE